MTQTEEYKKVKTILEKLANNVTIGKLKNDLISLSNKCGILSETCMIESNEMHASLLLDQDFDHSGRMVGMTKDEADMSNHASSLL